MVIKMVSGSASVGDRRARWLGGVTETQTEVSSEASASHGGKSLLT